MNIEFTFSEFFAGGGMARAGLNDTWTCMFSNDFDSIKAQTYRSNWGGEEFDDRDVRDLTISDLPESTALAWASFPCQDLSLAGNGHGIGSTDIEGGNTRSGALWPFLKLIEALPLDRKPKLIVLENVVGLLTNKNGKDFSAICTELVNLGYKIGANTINAQHFIPQSRLRVFITAILNDSEIPPELCLQNPSKDWHSSALIKAFEKLTEEVSNNWVWWNLGSIPISSKKCLNKFIKTTNVHWDTEEQTLRFIRMMSPLNIERLEKAKLTGKVQIGNLYLRMRPREGRNIQSAEISFNSVVGCLRTPKGGSSRSRIIVVNNNLVLTRLLQPDEAAKLMGLKSNYQLPESYNHAFKVIGDGVAVPVVKFLSERLLKPLIKHINSQLGC